MSWQKLAGVSTDTLRHYERKGVLHSQRAGNGYREYPEDALERVRMVRQGLAIGFTLDELIRSSRSLIAGERLAGRCGAWQPTSWRKLKLTYRK